MVRLLVNVLGLVLQLLVGLGRFWIRYRAVFILVFTVHNAGFNGVFEIVKPCTGARLEDFTSEAIKEELHASTAAAVGAAVGYGTTGTGIAAAHAHVGIAAQATGLCAAGLALVAHATGTAV